jgi:hypothetical protein
MVAALAATIRGRVAGTRFAFQVTVPIEGERR